MYKRLTIFALVLVIFVSTLGQAHAASSYIIALNSNNEIKVESKVYGSDMRIMVEKGAEKYYYSLSNENEKLPAQLGNGSYIVKILQNTKGNSYKVLEKSTLDVKNNSIDVFLTSSQPVYWEGKDKLIELGNTLLKDVSTDKDKVIRVYNYIINNIKYDYNKINQISTDYVPDVDTVLADKKGICYDYSAVFAGILRSQGIHTKLVKGYKNDMKEYHAWNEVLLDGKWVLIDTTYDAALSKGKVKPNMIKLASEYTKIREY